MSEEIVKSFGDTCFIIIQYYEELKHVIVKNKFHKSNKRLKMFIQKISKSNPVFRVVDKHNKISKKDKAEFAKFINHIKKCVVRDILAYINKYPHKNIINFIDANIRKYKKLITSVKKEVSFSGNIIENHKNKDKKMKSLMSDESDEDCDDDVSEEEEYSDSESDDSDYDGDDSETESDYDDTESEDELDSDEDESETSSYDEESESEDDLTEEDKEFLRRLNSKSGRKKASDKDTRGKMSNIFNNKIGKDKSVKDKKHVKDKHDPKDDLRKLKKFLVDRMNSAAVPIKKQISSFEELSKEEKDKIMKIIENAKENSSPLIYKVMLSNLPENVIQEMVQRLGSLDKNEDECPKYREWVNASLKIPLKKYTVCKLSKLQKDHKDTTKVKKFIDKTKKIMDDAVYGHEDAKKQILQFVAQNISNPNSKGLVLGIEGPMGNGKTTLIEKGFAKALGRPFSTIPLGGIQDGSFLEGHGYTYEGSKWGEIVNILINTGCMNPVIYMDELDKVSTTNKGDEINNMLIHLTDPSQNCHFKDKYFTDINIDLSQVIFIFSYNDRDAINPILMDRITHLKTRGFRSPEKLIICRKYILKNIVKDVGLSENDIKISDVVLNWLIYNYTHEGGVRQLKKICYEIIREINLRQLTDKKYKYPFEVKKDILEKDILDRHMKHKYDKIHSESTVGKINGLYATCNDTGGLILIEASFIPSDSEFKLQLTGNQGKVMQESMHVANTLAWNLLNDKVRERLKKQWKDSGRKGIHVHCPEGGVPKDGPSAGAAITTVIYSLLTNRKIHNNIAITGEIDLSGKIMAIGGLESKIFGAKNAGCSLVICPKENEDILRKILKDHPDLQTENFQIKMVRNIQEVMKLMLV
tara:strand:- start:7209 stop:9815 length:2607 start_codon:yes stop_codon:yes gene_type:complete